MFDHLVRATMIGAIAMTAGKGIVVNSPESTKSGSFQDDSIHELALEADEWSIGKGRCLLDAVVPWVQTLCSNLSFASRS